MTSRERLLCLLGGQTPDRVPVSPFVQEEYLSYYFRKKDTHRLLDAILLAEELDFDLITRQYLVSAPYFMTESAPNWDVRVDEEVRDGNYYRTTVIRTPGRDLRQVEGAPYNEDILSGIHFSTVEYLIKDEDDFEAFQKYVPAMDKPGHDAILEAGRFARGKIGQRGVTCPWAIGGVYNLASTYINVQNMLMDALADEDYYAAYMNLFTDIAVRNYAAFTESEFDCVGIQGNIANGAMMGEEFFRENVLPYERRALDVVIASGKPTVYHNCGNAKNLYPCYTELGITVWETVSPPPQGDNDLAEAKAYFGDALVLSGNFDQVNFLKTAAPEAVEKAAAETMAVGKKGGHYIFAASDYLEVGTPLENVTAMLRGARSQAEY
ncbi:MAG: hypothetical protein LUE17_14475 [Planctomycetaceae bacterium]|nr:hypothetical protein [Planctomycetaceae bacterium]